MNEQEKTNVVILGSTGSIGQQALEVIDMHPDRFRLLGLAARDEVQVLLDQIHKYHPAAVAISDKQAYNRIKNQVGEKTKLIDGLKGMSELAALEDADIILVAVSGAVGILPTLDAIKANKRIALANKETLVAAGDIVMEEIKNREGTLLPVDSEHSAVFQCLTGERRYAKKIWLTASGGPFRDYSHQDLENVTVEMALKHPNWKMGPKITVDSATLMNKGLEVIEAHHLFEVAYEDIDVVVQRESVIHSMVEFVDGSFIGHLGTADMRIPIQYALTYPERIESPASSLDFTRLGGIHFEKPDCKKFPALNLAYQAGQIGGTMPAVLNAANEVAVNSFLNGGIKFIQISHLVEEIMSRHENMARPDLEMVLQADRWAREACYQIITKEAR